MYYVYILKSKRFKNKIYTGFTSESPAGRLRRHNDGRSFYTNKYKPWKLAWYCAFEDKFAALRFEKYLKTASGIAFKNKRLISRAL